MIPQHFYYQLVVLGLLWLVVMLHVAWSSRGVTTQTTRSTPIIPRRKRSTLLLDSGGLMLQRGLRIGTHF
jgi:hypothetical protein